MLQITAKTDYGLLLMVSLAEGIDQGPLSLRYISETKKLPYRFLSQIAIPLRQAGLIESKEGVQGGYRLTRRPETISVGDVVRALDGDVRLVRCIAHGDGVCPSQGMCVLPPFWMKISNHLNSAFDELSLSELVKIPSTQPVHDAAAA